MARAPTPARAKAPAPKTPAPKAPEPEVIETVEVETEAPAPAEPANLVQVTRKGGGKEMTVTESHYERYQSQLELVESDA